VPVLGNAPLGLTTLRALRRKAATFDVVIAYGSTTLPACAAALVGARTPFVYRSIGDPARWSRGRVHRWRTGVLFRRASHVVALWPGASLSIQHLYGVSPSRLSCVPNARPVPLDDDGDDRAASRARARVALGLPLTGSVIAWAGALSREKRPELAVDAVAALDECFLVIAGDGPLQAAVAARCAAQLPGRHLLAGLLVPLTPLWAAADVVLLTSRTEGMPGVLIEAALQGVPAVATDVGGVAEIVLDGTTGELVPADADAGQLAAALRRVVGRRTELGAAAERRARESFLWPQVLPSWLEVLRRSSTSRR
jgi:glycosyltransferase involved in cell wall biosynthesis